MHRECPYCRYLVEITDAALQAIGCPSCGGSFELKDEEQTLTQVEHRRRLGKFELLERVGSGGYGAVWKARDTELDRVVAVKIPHLGRMATDSDVQRFLREARSSAQLHHPGIVSVHEVGFDGPIPYLVSEFIDGIRFTDLLDARRLGMHEAAELIAQIAEALDYAHSAGVVHRDIKPSNIMLERDHLKFNEQTPLVDFSTPRGVTLVDDPSHRYRPLIMDFGLALRPGSDLTMTMDGEVLGTPAYMSPEQAAGQSHRVDRRSDVYSLGVVLYKSITGELPFLGNNRMIREQVLYEEPRSPRRLNDRIPRDLETVTLKCMAKEPAHRYQTAAELATDLRHCLAGEPVRARPVGAAGRLWRWAKRKPLLAGLNVAVVLLSLIVAAVSAVASLRIAAARNQAEERLVRQYVANGTRLMDSGELLMTLPWFVAALPPERAGDGRAAAHRMRLAAVQSHCPKLLQLWFHESPVLHAEFTRDGHYVAAGCQNGKVLVWDARTGQSVLPPLLHTDAVTRVTFSSDGRYIATASVDATARVWSARNGEPIGRVLQHSLPVRDAAFSPDGRYVATASGETSQVWNVETGEPVTALLEHRDAVNQLRFSPDGSHLLTAIGSAARGRLGEALIWDIATGELAVPPLRHGDDVFEASYSPDGRTIVTASYDRTVRLWDASTGELVAPPLQHDSSVTHASFAPDSRRLVTVSHEIARVWDLATGSTAIHPEKELAGAVLAASFGPDGQAILGIGLDRTVRVWNAATGQLLTSPLPHSAQVNYASFGPEGLEVLTASSDGIVRIWGLGASGLNSASLDHHGPVNSASFSADGKRVVTASDDYTARVWDPLSGKPVTESLNHLFRVECASFSPDGRSVVTAEGGGMGSRSLVWDTATGELIGRALQHDGAVKQASFCPDSRRVLTASLDHKARLWDTSSGSLLATFEHADGVNHASFAPDGRHVVTASRDRTARVWSVENGLPACAPLTHDQGVNYASFSRDSRLVITTSSDRSARIWNAKTGALVAKPLMHSDTVVHASFSGDGRRVVTASRDHTARVWDATSGAPVTPPMILDGAVNHASFSPEGRYVLTASGRGGSGYVGEARLWDADTAEPISPSLTHRGAVTWASFSPDGHSILTASADGTARIWGVPFETRPAQDLLLTAQVLSGYRLDATHGFVPVELASLRDAWQILRQRYPEQFTIATPERLAWHERGADDAWVQKQWFAATWHLDHLLNLEPGRWQFWARRGESRAEQGNWTAAADDYAKAIDLGTDDDDVSVDHAVLQLQTGNLQGYRDACQHLLDRSARTSNPVAVKAVVEACVLAPQAVEGAEQLTRSAETAATHPYHDVFHSMVGAALYREGKFEASLEHLDTALEIQGAYAGRDWLFSAMAHSRLGHSEEARHALARAVQRMDHEVPDDPAIKWSGRLGLRFLRAEAESLLSQ